MTFTLTVSDQAVMNALTRLHQAVAQPRPVLQALGEDLMTRSKERFAASRGPDGAPWAANSQATLTRYIERRGGFGKNGINKKGQALAMGKRPLIGESGDLRRQFHVQADDAGVTVSNSMIYAAMQQFGGTKAQFPQLWGDIPARPFLPVTAAGELYPDEQARVVAEIARYIAHAADGGS